MDNRDALIKILPLAYGIGNDNLVTEVIKHLASEYGLKVVDNSYYHSIRDINLYSPIGRGTRISAIKELRERARDNGFEVGLKEAKDEVDRRIMLAETGYHPDDIRG